MAGEYSDAEHCSLYWIFGDSENSIGTYWDSLFLFLPSHSAWPDFILLSPCALVLFSTELRDWPWLHLKKMPILVNFDVLSPIFHEAPAPFPNYFWNWSDIYSTAPASLVKSDQYLTNQRFQLKNCCFDCLFTFA